MATQVTRAKIRKRVTQTIIRIMSKKIKARATQLTDKKTDIFQMSDKNRDCLYSLEPPWWGDSNEYPQSIIFSK